MVALKTWLFCGIFYKILDILTTFYLVYSQGLNAESSPFVSNMINAYGIIPGLGINGIITGFLLLVLYKYREKELLIISTLLLTIPVILNSFKVLGF